MKINMRTEQEMFDLIIGIAKQDPRIHAVYMNGSRTNSNVPKDIFQDYDIIYVVSETKPFYEDETWIDHFSERLYMQMPEKSDVLRGEDCNLEDTYGWLIQFADGNRLDLHVSRVAYAKKDLLADTLCMILLDKQSVLPMIPPSTDENYHVQRPTLYEFLGVCNEFWWCLNNVAKGLWREEIPYVMDMVNACIRPQLVSLLSWKIGLDTNFSCSVGKSAKYMDRYLDQETYNRFLATYAPADLEQMWQATFIMCKLFDEVAKEVADRLGYRYNQAEADASYKHLEHVHQLPKDATHIY